MNHKEASSNVRLSIFSAAPLILAAFLLIAAPSAAQNTPRPLTPVEKALIIAQTENNKAQAEWAREGVKKARAEAKQAQAFGGNERVHSIADSIAAVGATIAAVLALLALLIFAQTYRIALRGRRESEILEELADIKRAVEDLRSTAR